MSDSDSDSDSDISDLFEKAKADQAARKRKLKQESDDDDGDDDGSDDDSEVSVQLLSARRRNKHGSSTVEDKLIEMSQKKAIRERKMRMKARKLEIDSDDDLDDEDLKVIEKQKAAAPKVDVSLLDDDSSDEDNGPAPSGQASFSRLQQMDPKRSLELQRLHDMRLELTKSNATTTSQENNLNGVVDLTSQPQLQQHLTRSMLLNQQVAGLGAANPAYLATLLAAQQQIQQQQVQQEEMMNVGPQTLRLLIRAEITCKASNTTKEKSTMVTALDTETVQSIIDKTLSQLQLNPALHTAGLKYDGRPLLGKNFPLAMEGIPDGATIVATIISSDFGLGTATAARPKADVGKLITVTLRRQDNGGKTVEDTMKIGIKEKLEVLVEKYKAANKGLRSVALHFDGERMNLNHTPAHYDMESEDLIDIVAS